MHRPVKFTRGSAESLIKSDRGPIFAAMMHAVLPGCHRALRILRSLLRILRTSQIGHRRRARVIPTYLIYTLYLYPTLITLQQASGTTWALTLQT